MRRATFIVLTLTLTAFGALLTQAACDSGKATAPRTDVIDMPDTPAIDDGATTDVPPHPDVPQADVPLAEDLVPADVPPVDDIEDVAPDVLPDVVVPACVGTPGVVAWPTDVSNTFLRGPFVQDVRDSHAVVAFRPALPLTEQGCVQWSIAGVASAIPIQACIDPDAYGQYAVRLDDLPPDTEVTYQVSAGASLTAGPFTFRSAPPLDRPQRILVMSDLHANPERTATVLSKIVSQGLADGIDFAMTVGDHVDSPQEPQFDDLFEGLRPLLHRVPVFTTIGNHEGRNANYFEAFVLPEADPPDPEAAELYYSFRRGNVWIGVLELIDWQISWTIAQPLGQVTWLEKELDSEAARSARYRLLFIHEPPWGKNWTPCTDAYFGEQSLRDLLVPLAHEKGVSAIFSGHFHDYEHGQLDGVDLFVCGGAGGGLETVDCTPPAGFPDPWKWVETHHHLTVETGCDALTVVATDLDGTEIDRVSLAPIGQ